MGGLRSRAGLPFFSFKGCKRFVRASVATEFSFNLPCDLVKSVDGDSSSAHPRRIQGIGSTEREDLQEETLIQRGMDIDYFRTEGWISDEHDRIIRDKNGNEVNRVAAANIGVPVADGCMITRAGLWITADLIPPVEETHSPNCACPPCRSEWWMSFIKSLAKSGTGRRAGFSVDGSVQRRNGGTILKCFIRRTALTSSPIGRGTYAELAKSLSASPWCEVPENATEPSCKCSGCGIGDEAARKSAMDGLTFEQAVSRITGKQGWHPQVAKAFAGALYGHNAHTH